MSLIQSVGPVLSPGLHKSTATLKAREFFEFGLASGIEGGDKSSYWLICVERAVRSGN